MSAPITQKAIQGAVEQYWGYVYAQNQNGLKSLISSDIKVEVQLTQGSEKEKNVQFTFEQFLKVINSIGSAISSIQDNRRSYSQFSALNGQATIQTHFIQNLMVTVDGTTKLMESTGTQFWTFNGVQFVALKIIEKDIFPA